MAIAFVSSTTASSATATPTFSINKPTGVTQGRLMVLVTHVALNSTDPSSWTRAAQTSSFNGDRLTILYKVAGSSEPSSYSIPRFADTDYPSQAWIGVYSGASTIESSAQVSDANASGSSPTPGILDPLSNGSLSLIAYSRVANTPTGSSWGSTPSGWSLRERYSTTNPSWIISTSIIEKSNGADRPAWTGNPDYWWGVVSVAIKDSNSPRMGIPISFFE